MLPKWPKSTHMNYWQKAFSLFSFFSISSFLLFLGFRISSRKQTSYLDDDFLAALFNFSGITQNPTSGLFSVGLIKNVESFYHFILNWEIWQFAPLSTQSLLFNSIVELLDVRNGVKAQFNVCHVCYTTNYFFSELILLEIRAQNYKWSYHFTVHA